MNGTTFKAEGSVTLGDAPKQEGRAVKAMEWRNDGKDLQITYADDGSIWLYKNVTFETVVHEDVTFKTDKPVEVLPLDFFGLPPVEIKRTLYKIDISDFVEVPTAKSLNDTDPK